MFGDYTLLSTYNLFGDYTGVQYSNADCEVSIPNIELTSYGVVNPPVYNGDISLNLPFLDVLSRGSVYHIEGSLTYDETLYVFSKMLKTFSLLDSYEAKMYVKTKEQSKLQI